MVYPLANLFGFENTTLILILGLLLFGRRLPEVGRSLGRGIVEFKKGLQGIEEDIDDAVKAKPANPSISRLPDAPAAGYKFDPYTGKPLNVEPPAPPKMRFDPYTGKPLPQESAPTYTDSGVGG